MGQGLASKEETDALIEYAKPKFETADVVYMDHDKGKPVDLFRTSLNYRPNHNETLLIATMEARAASLTRMPPSHFESPQILEYAQGGFYHAHDDAARLEFYKEDRRLLTDHHYGFYDRMITVFWYMNTVPKGGETNFPRAHGGHVPPTMDKCVQGLMVAPVQGMAVMWYNMEPRGIVDPLALHSACAVGEGTKHAINIWVYNKDHQKTGPARDPKHPQLKIIRGENFVEDSTQKKHPNSNSLSLINNVGSRVEVFWHDGASLNLVADIEPNSKADMETFPGHRFTAKLASGVTVGSYVVKKKPSQQKFVISSERAEEL